MLRLLSLVLLGGCELVFRLDDPGPTEEVGAEICGGNDDDSGPALFGDCVNSRRAELVRPASLRTGAYEDPEALGDCDLVIVQTDLDETALCVIAADDIVLANTVIVGPRPLMLMAVNRLQITGTVSVTSRGDETGAGATVVCPSGPGQAGPNDGGGGGGAGGSFASGGGMGGRGSPELSGGLGGAPVTVTALTSIRGGCGGGAGGVGLEAPSGGGAAGRSGGALYLVAGDQIRVTGTIDASGEAGQGGQAGFDVGGAGGGGGGGSGGLIAFDAPSIVVDGAILIANGAGGGGGGTPAFVAGTAGANPDPASAFPFSAIGGNSDGGGNGGDGANALALDLSTLAGHDVIDGSGGGGGGGGGVGFIIAFGVIETGPGGVAASPPVR